MAGSRITLTIGADGSVAVREVKRVEDSLDHLGVKTKQAARDTDSLGSALGGMSVKLAGAFTAAAVVGFTRQIASAADQTKLLNMQVSRLSDGTAGFEDLYGLAQRLGIALADAGQQVNFFVPGLQKLGLGFGQSVGFVEDLNKALRVYGVSGQQAASITTQLGQALSSGQLSGDELKSLRENAAGLGVSLEKAVQKMLGTTTSLKDLGTQGALTSKVVYDAFNVAFDAIRNDMETLPETLEQQDARFGNAATRLMSALDDALHLSDFWQFVTQTAIGHMERIADMLSGAPVVGPFANDESEFNALVEKRIELMDEYAKAVERVNELGNPLVTSRSGAKAINEAQADLRAIANELGVVEQAIAKINNRNIEAAQTTKTATDAAGAGISEYAAKATAILGQYITGMDGVAERLTTLEPLFDSVSKRVGIPKEVVISVGVMESRLKELAVSGAGAGGAMQFMSGTAETVARQMQAAGVATYTAEQIQTDYTAAITAGAFHLQDLITKYVSLEKALIAYNAGAGKVGKDIADLPKETQDYIAKLVPAIASLTREFEGASAAEKILSGESKKVAKAFEEIGATEPSVRVITNIVEQLANKYLTAERRAKEFAAAQNLLKVAVDTNATSQERATKILAAMSEEIDRAGVKIPTIAELWSESLMELGRNIQNTLGDAFTDLFDGTIKTAKDAMKKLKDVILSALGDLAAALLMRPVNVLINGIIGTASGTAAGTAQASGGTGTSATSLSGVSNWFGSNSLGEAGGTLIAEAYRYSGINMPSYMASGAMNLASTSNFALGASSLAGGLLGNYLFGDEGYGSIGASIGSTAGAVIGSMIMPGIGTAIGGLLGGTAGGWLGSLFGGGEEEKLAELDIQRGTFSISGGQGDWTDEQTKAIQGALDEANQLLDVFGTALGSASQAQRETFSRTAPQTLAPEQIEGWIEHEFNSILSQMISTSTGALGDMAREAWESVDGDVGAFLQALQPIFDAADRIPELTSSLEDAGYKFGDSSQEAVLHLAMLSGSIDQLLATEQRYQNFVLSKEEQAAKLQGSLAEALGAVGLSVPTSRAELEALVNSIDTTTEAGREQRVAVMALLDPLMALIEYLEQTGEAVNITAEAMEAALEKYRELLLSEEEQLAATTTDLSDAFAELGLSLPESREELRALVDSLDLSTDAGKETYASIMALSGALDTLYDASEKAMESAQEQYRELLMSEEEQLAAMTTDLSEAFAELGLSLPESREELRALVDSLDLSTDSGKDAYTSILALSGALDTLYDSSEQAMESAQEQYRKLLMSEEEQLAAMTTDLSEAFADLGLSLPESREELRSLVDSLDLSTDSGKDAYTSIMALSGALDTLYDASEKAADAAEKAAASAESVLEQTIYTTEQQRVLAMERAAAEANAIGISLLGIDISKLTQEQFAEAIKALGGVGAVVDLLGDQATSYVDAVQRYYDAAAREPVEEYYEETTNAVADAFAQIFESIMDWVRSVRGEVLDILRPQSLDIAQSQFSQQLALAQSGDIGAMETITEYADRYLSAARRMSSSRGGYEEVAGFVTARVEALTRSDRGITDPQVDELARLREENQAANLSLISLTDRLARYLSLIERWEAIGMPATRTA